MDIEKIQSNIRQIRDRIMSACARSGRRYEDVRLIAVSKTVDVARIKVAYEAGIRDFGENYVQEMLKKVDLLPEDIRWHFIGSLQTNKIKYLVGKTEYIQTAYKKDHLLEINKRAEKKGVIANVLLEVNIGMESTKSGVNQDGVEELIRYSQDMKSLRVMGLMCIPPVAEPEESRRFFKNLRFIRDYINNKFGSEVLRELSMGMSSDFEVAIEEGATMVRVGNAIFGERKKGGDL
jgi:pyridoxal phosphate enzyme (YggS family)